MADLFPTFPELDDNEADEGVLETYSPSFAFDFDKGDFVTDGAHRVQPCDGYDAWKQWCLKTILTERDTCVAYSTNIGVEMESALKGDTLEAVELMVARTITEALMIHPSTKSVGDFAFDASGDALHVSFVVCGKDVAAFDAEMNVATR